MSNELSPSTSLETSKVSIMIALSKAGYNYQKLLQGAEDISFTKDNLQTAGEPLKALRKIKTTLEKLENPHTAAWKAWNEARKSLFDPVEEAINRKTGEFKTVNDAVIKENKEAEDERNRKVSIKTVIANFTLTYSTKIANATTNDELVALQKLLGAEKSRKNVYQEFLPDLFQAVEGLEEAMRKQKEHVKSLEAIKNKIEDAKIAGDDEKIVELLGDLEVVSEKIEETKTGVQELAINQSTAFEPPDAEIILPATAKVRRTTWEWRILDIVLFQRRNPELVELIPNKAKIDAIIRERRENKTLKPIVENGLEIYQQEHL